MIRLPRLFAFAILPLCLLVLLAPCADATGCRVVAPAQIVVPVATVVTPYVTPVAVVQAVPVLYQQQYSVTYAGSSVSDLQTATAELRVALAEFKGYTAGFAASIKGGTVPGPLQPRAAPRMSQADEPAVVPLMVTRCAGCHDAAVAASKGGKLVLTEAGRAKVLTPEDLGSVLDRLSTKDASRAMPRGQQISAEERLALIQAAMAGQGQAAQPQQQGAKE